MLLIAHRGDTINFPENTLEAFQSAFDHDADGIEIDIQVDGSKAIIVHDYLHQKSDKYPTLEEIIEKFSNQGRLEIEIKSLNAQEIKIITDIIIKHNPPNFEVTTSVLPAIPHIRKALPDANIGAIFPDKLFEEWMPAKFIARYIDGNMQLTNANVVHLPQSLYNKKVIITLKNKGYALHHHIKSADKEEYKRLVDLGIDQATFDNINLLSKIK